MKERRNAESKKSKHQTMTKMGNIMWSWLIKSMVEEINTLRSFLK